MEEGEDDKFELTSYMDGSELDDNNLAMIEKQPQEEP